MIYRFLEPRKEDDTPTVSVDLEAFCDTFANDSRVMVLIERFALETITDVAFLRELTKLRESIFEKCAEAESEKVGE